MIRALAYTYFAVAACNFTILSLAYSDAWFIIAFALTAPLVAFAWKSWEEFNK